MAAIQSLRDQIRNNVDKPLAETVKLLKNSENALQVAANGPNGTELLIMLASSLDIGVHTLGMVYILCATITAPSALCSAPVDWWRITVLFIFPAATTTLWF